MLHSHVRVFERAEDRQNDDLGWLNSLKGPNSGDSFGRRKALPDCF